jgi:hypothetical protein
VKLGPWQVSKMGLGCMGMSFGYGTWFGFCIGPKQNTVGADADDRYSAAAQKLLDV